MSSLQKRVRNFEYISHMLYQCMFGWVGLSITAWMKHLHPFQPEVSNHDLAVFTLMEEWKLLCEDVKDAINPAESRV